MDGEGRFPSVRGRTLEIVVLLPIILIVIFTVVYFAAHEDDEDHLLAGNEIVMVLNYGSIKEKGDEYRLILNITIFNGCKYDIQCRQDSLKLIRSRGPITDLDLSPSGVWLRPGGNITLRAWTDVVPILERPRSIRFVSEENVAERTNRVESNWIDLSLDPFCRRNEMFCLANAGTTLFDIKEWNGNGAECMESADLNEDGRSDLLMCNFGFDRYGRVDFTSNNSIVVFLGKVGGFEEQRFVRATGSNPKWLEAAELTGDGHIDLVVAYWNSGAVHLLEGHGDGTFGDRPFFIIDNISQPFDLRAADIDLDGNMDLVVLNGHNAVNDYVHSNYGFNDTITVLYGNAVHGYGTDRRTIINGSDGFLEVGDLNGDGLPDIIVSELVFLQAPNGSFGDAIDLGNPGMGYPVLADIDDDGRSELLLGNRMFRFGDELVTEFIGDHYPGPSRSTIADLDKDGRKDILRGDEIYFQTSNGTFDNVRKMHLDLTLQLNQQVRSIIDVDGDGMSDIIYNNGSDLMVMYQSSDSDGDGIIDEYDPNENKED